MTVEARISNRIVAAEKSHLAHRSLFNVNQTSCEPFGALALQILYSAYSAHFLVFELWALKMTVEARISNRIVAAEKSHLAHRSLSMLTKLPVNLLAP